MGRLVLGVLLAALSLSACRSQEVQVLPFPQAFQSAVEQIAALPGVRQGICHPMTTARDYRYHVCIHVDKTTKEDTVREQIGQIFEKVGARLDTSSDTFGRPSSGYVFKGTPYSLSLSGGGNSNLELTAYQDGLEIPYVLPREGIDQNAFYALSDPKDVAQDFIFQFLISEPRDRPTIIAKTVACGEATTTQATLCYQAGLTGKDYRSLLGEAFVGFQDQFTLLDQKQKYEYRSEFSRAALEKDTKFKYPTSAQLLTKVDGQHYLYQHNMDWPAYTFEITLPPDNETGDLKITAKRRASMPIPGSALFKSNTP